jgi:hypothetical protein
VPKTPEEQAFWDAAYVASFQLWPTHAASKAMRMERVPTIAEFGALIANEALTERRKAQEPSNASP